MKRCTNCGTPVPETFNACHKCGWQIPGRPTASEPPPVQPSGKPNKDLTALAATGVFLLLFSLPALVFFLMFFDPSVGTEYGRVNNIGLLQDRQNGVIVSGLAVLISVICMVAGRKR